MLTHLEFPDFEHDMSRKKGVNLAIRIDDDDNAEGKVERFIDRVLMLVNNEVRKYNKRFDYKSASQLQKDTFYEACLEQALYLFVLGDMSLISGYDPINNTVIPVEEIRKRAFSDNAKQMLLNAGLLYRGISGGYDGIPVPGYGRRGWY